MNIISSGIYCYTNEVNGKKYIGQSVNIEGRHKAHKNNANCKTCNEYYTPFSQAIRKYGFDKFHFQILATDIENKEILNLLESYYIDLYNSKIPRGYNQTDGGDSKRRWTEEEKKNFSFQRGCFTEEEIIFLREGYANGESPTEIYKQFSDRISWGGFINVWRGTRYSHIMPEVFQNRRTRKKLTAEQVLEIRELYSVNHFSYQTLADRYNVSKQCIATIIHRETWKNI